MEGLDTINLIILINLVVLKLFNLIDWSWLWVLAPLWMPLVLVVIGSIFLFIWRFICG